MRFDLKNPNAGMWFDLPDDEPTADGPEGVESKQSRICLRVCNAEILEKIEAATVKKRDVWKRGQHFEKVEVDEAARNRAIWDYTIVDWENIQDENGLDIPCTAENKVALMMGSPLFVQIVSERLDVVREHNDTLARISEKNLSSTSNGST